VRCTLLAVKGSAAAATVLVIVAACAGPASGRCLTSCADLVPNCQATRLPDQTLIGAQTSGALKSVGGMDLTGIISFDEALRRAGAEDGHPDATTVQVTLGSADADEQHWGHGTNLYYGIDWGGVCQIPIGARIHPSTEPTESCTQGTWGTVIDAHTGEFIVGGS
jgi:hypothetical protein